tara:strand:+ start:245 stop:550 length:306 start_codon:yes stop_codon:yes gene_type:complete
MSDWFEESGVDDEVLLGQEYETAMHTTYSGIAEEAVDHPDHYNQGNMEVIDAIEGLGYGEGFCVGSIIKYVTRYKHKNGIEDLKKALWYVNYLIELETKNK